MKQQKPKAVKQTEPKVKPPKANPATGRTHNGYSPEKIALRAAKRENVKLDAPVLKKGRTRKGK